MSVAKADRFTTLKAKVKAEMQRRNQSGSVASYGGSSYDYTVPPAAGKTVQKEHRDKLIGPMQAVNSNVIPAAKGIISEDELANLETRVAVWGARQMTDRSGSDCKSGCTGTCYTGCATGCSGCSGCSGCGSGCPNSCSGCTGCSGCGGACSSSCSGGCDGCTSCSGDCEGCTGCSGDCRSSCRGCSGCGEACSSSCSGGCGGGCSGCGSGCESSCGGTCDGTCQGCGYANK